MSDKEVLHVSHTTSSGIFARFMMAKMQTLNSMTSWSFLGFSLLTLSYQLQASL
jgi:hypothetical protein